MSTTYPDIDVTDPNEPDYNPEPTEKTAEQISYDLKMPWPASEVKSRQGPGGKQLSYIDARQVMHRLDKVLGPENWSDDYKSLDGKTCCTLSLYIDGRWIAKSDGAGDTSIEGEKGGFSDSFKRAAVKWGIGRYLYRDGPPMTPEQYKDGWKRPTSVAKTVIDEMKITVDEDSVYEYYRAINEAYEKEDHYGLIQIWNELIKDNDMYTVVWNRLGSEIRTYVRKQDYFRSEEE
jgi:hypothetical protein